MATQYPNYTPSRNRPHKPIILGYGEPMPINLNSIRRLKLACDEAPAAPSSSSGPDLFDRLGKLLRIIRKRLSDEEWVELGQILAANGAAEDDADYQNFADTDHIKRAGGDPAKLLAPRGAQDQKDRGAKEDAAFREMFPDASKIKQESGYGADIAKPATPSRRQTQSDSESFEKMFPDSKRIK